MVIIEPQDVQHTARAEHEYLVNTKSDGHTLALSAVANRPFNESSRTVDREPRGQSKSLYVPIQMTATVKDLPSKCNPLIAMFGRQGHQNRLLAHTEW